MKKPLVLANAGAIVSGLFYIGCVILSWISPEPVKTIGRSLIHSFDVSVLPSSSLDLNSLIIGLISFMAMGWIFFFGLSFIYNKLAK